MTCQGHVAGPVNLKMVCSAAFCLNQQFEVLLSGELFLGEVCGVGGVPPKVFGLSLLPMADTQKTEGWDSVT